MGMCSAWAINRPRASKRAVEQFDATTLVLAGQEAVVDDLGFLVIEER